MSTTNAHENASEPQRHRLPSTFAPQLEHLLITRPALIFFSSSAELLPSFSAPRRVCLQSMLGGTPSSGRFGSTGGLRSVRGSGHTRQRVAECHARREQPLSA